MAADKGRQMYSNTGYRKGKAAFNNLNPVAEDPNEGKQTKYHSEAQLNDEMENSLNKTHDYDNNSSAQIPNQHSSLPVDNDNFNAALSGDGSNHNEKLKKQNTF